MTTRRGMPTLRTAGGAVVAVVLAGCAGSPFGDSTPAVAPAPMQPVVMNGRWILAAPNAPSCGMNFAGAAGGQEGTIAPEGGCPGNFFTGRHWKLAAGALTVNDQNNEPLAQFSYADGHFEGKTTAGTPVTLSRQPSEQ